MQVVARKTLKDFWERHPQAEVQLKVWFSQVSKAEWATPEDVRAMFQDADFVGDNRVIFNILHNRFRLVVHVSYTFRSVLIKFVGTHKDYDRIDPETI